MKIIFQIRLCKKKNFINIVREPAASRNRFFKNPCHDLFNAMGITTAHPE